MKSMTGFSSVLKKTKSAHYEVSLRAVNGRFLEIRFHLPREILFLESAFREKIQKRFRRGTVDLFVSRKIITSQKVEVSLNAEVFQGYLQVYKDLSKKMKTKKKPEVDFLMRLPEVIRLETSAEPDKNEEGLLSDLIDLALEKADQERQREGSALKTHLQDLVQRLEQLAAEIEGHREEANVEISKRFDTRLKLRLEGKEWDSSRIAQEVAFLIEKSDINEEIQRLSEHVRNFRQIIAQKEVEGKKLDFYVQELLREVNTVGSKSQVAKLTQAVIEAKSIIEKMREQVQNVE